MHERVLRRFKISFIQIAIVITDGKQTKTGVYTSLAVASEGIKNKGVTVYAIGIGNGVDRNELEEIASDSEYVFTPSSFRALRTIAPLIRTEICEGTVNLRKKIPFSSSIRQKS